MITFAVRYITSSGTHTIGPACKNWACAVLSIGFIDPTLIDAFVVNGVPRPLSAPVPAMQYLLQNQHVARAMRQAIDADSADPAPVSFQRQVAAWAGECFPAQTVQNTTERGDRVLEEVLELLQSHGYDRNRVGTLVDYVFGRPVGEPSQEVGGVMVTLALYCDVAGLDMDAAARTELVRINTPEVMAKISAKQQAKNALHFDTPLPGNGSALNEGGAK